ncbi:hypothetical protein Ciccas_013061 [Cichlidogyrus casuarinus]|uniref:Uncharacterized protein n=1 Tax=Cichlidogyrus casuarinus TaxID=1844966 RepID=A0ABD2PMC2_9PLAT
MLDAGGIIISEQHRVGKVIDAGTAYIACAEENSEYNNLPDNEAIYTITQIQPLAQQATCTSQESNEEDSYQFSVQDPTPIIMRHHADQIHFRKQSRDQVFSTLYEAHDEKLTPMERQKTKSHFQKAFVAGSAMDYAPRVSAQKTDRSMLCHSDIHDVSTETFTTVIGDLETPVSLARVNRNHTSQDSVYTNAQNLENGKPAKLVIIKEVSSQATLGENECNWRAEQQESDTRKRLTFAELRAKFEPKPMDSDEEKIVPVMSMKASRMPSLNHRGDSSRVMTQGRVAEEIRRRENTVTRNDDVRYSMNKSAGRSTERNTDLDLKMEQRRMENRQAMEEDEDEDETDEFIFYPGMDKKTLMTPTTAATRNVNIVIDSHQGKKYLDVVCPKCSNCFMVDGEAGTVRQPPPPPLSTRKNFNTNRKKSWRNNPYEQTNEFISKWDNELNGYLASKMPLNDRKATGRQPNEENMQANGKPFQQNDFIRVGYPYAPTQLVNDFSSSYPPEAQTHRHLCAFHRMFPNNMMPMFKNVPHAYSYNNGPVLGNNNMGLGGPNVPLI